MKNKEENLLKKNMITGEVDIYCPLCTEWLINLHHRDKEPIRIGCFGCFTEMTIQWDNELHVTIHPENKGKFTIIEHGSSWGL